jgi:hypothetical protein
VASRAGVARSALLPLLLLLTFLASVVVDHHVSNESDQPVVALANTAGDVRVSTHETPQPDPAHPCAVAEFNCSIKAASSTNRPVIAPMEHRASNNPIPAAPVATPASDPPVIALAAFSVLRR